MRLQCRFFRCITLVLLGLWSIGLHALDFKGIAIGATKTSVLSEHPEAKCEPFQTPYYQEICYFETTVARQPAMLSILLWEGVVDGLQIDGLPASGEREVLGALKAKYGPPLQDGGVQAKSSWVVGETAVIFTPALVGRGFDAEITIMTKAANQRAVAWRQQDL